MRGFGTLLFPDAPPPPPPPHPPPLPRPTVALSLKEETLYLSTCRPRALPDGRGGAKSSLSTPDSARSPDLPAGVEGESNPPSPFLPASRSASLPGLLQIADDGTPVSPRTCRSDHGGPRATSNRTPRTADSSQGPKGRRLPRIRTRRKSETLFAFFFCFFFGDVRRNVVLLVFRAVG